MTYNPSYTSDMGVNTLCLYIVGIYLYLRIYVQVQYI